MCGFVFAQGEFSFDDFQRSLDLISHRGPDHSGSYCKDNVSLGHNRLSIIDLEASSNQPMFSSCGNYILVYNGEIYNYQNLRNELLQQGYVFKTNSDSEVLLAAYSISREKNTNFLEFLNSLNGMFSFVIYDLRYKSFIAGRDRFGVKPLFLFKDKETIILASELKAFMGFSFFDAKINLLSVKNYLDYLWNPSAEKLFKNVYSIDPGCVISGSLSEGINKSQWLRKNETSTSSKNRDWINDCDALIRKAVHSQMISDVEVGGFLSGGVDSSLICKYASERNVKFKSFTIEHVGSKGLDNEDLKYAEDVAERFGIDLVVVKSKPDSFFDELRYMVKSINEPLADPAALNVGYICEAARENNIKVLLSGSGGDDLFTGYRRHLVEYNRARLNLPPKLEALIGNLFLNISRLDKVKFRKLSKLGSLLSKNQEDRLFNYFSWSNDFDLNDIMLNKNNYHNHIDFKKYLDTLPSQDNDLMRMMQLEKRFFLTEHNLIYTDRMSMANGVEVRVPFLDNELLEFSNILPKGQLINKSQGKVILKKVLSKYLPQDIVYRKKVGFGSPLRSWIISAKQLILDTIITEKNINEFGVFDYPKVVKLIEQNYNGEIDASHTILSIICIQIWMEEYTLR